MASTIPISSIANLNGRNARAAGFVMTGVISTVDVTGIVSIKSITPKTITTKR
jgi:translation elongation factor EF-Tu-like GTPase